MRASPDVARARQSDPSTMIHAADEYWDFDRATYEDELGAWRERTAVALVTTVAVAEAPVPTRRIERRASRRAAARPFAPRRPIAGRLASDTPRSSRRRTVGRRSRPDTYSPARGSTSPARWAMDAASSRFATPSLERMFET